MSVSGPTGMCLGEWAKAQEMWPCDFNLFYEENVTWQGEKSLDVESDGKSDTESIVPLTNCAHWCKHVSSLSLKLLIEPLAFEDSGVWGGNLSPALLSAEHPNWPCLLYDMQAKVRQAHPPPSKNTERI